jgi:hypothetical protein
MMKHALFLVIVLGLAFTSGAEFLPRPLQYECFRASDEAMTIDGNISDGEWETAPWSSDFVHIVGKIDSPKPRFKTRVKMLWSDTHLYIAAHLDETDIHGRLTDHDASLYTENAFEVFIDPDGDGKNYCELEFNALNTTMDLLMNKPYRDRGRPDLSFELEGMKTAVHIEGTLNDATDIDRGWDVEIAIPFPSLKNISQVDHPRDGDAWRFNFARAEYPEPEKPEWSVWSPQGRADMHVPERYGYVKFKASAPARKR